MKLTKAGKAALLVLLFVGVVVFGLFTAPYGIDYSQGWPRVVNLYDQPRNINHK